LTEAYFKPLLIVLILALLWVLETVIPVAHDRRNRWRHDAANLTMGVLNTLLVAVLLAGTLHVTTAWAQANQVGLLHWLHWPVWVELMLAIVLFDLWQYGWHRLNHRWPLLWRFHSVHHTDEDLDASSALRFHAGEILLSSILRLLVLPLIGMSMTQLLVYELLALPVILFHHSNVQVPEKLDRLLRVMIVTPRIHRVHHSDRKQETDSNYASLFACWDLLFGSRVMREDMDAVRFGLGVRFHAERWQSVKGMLVQPFQRNLF
jgi:sterol desaturase/sphingolipid hydroxylase (fatty acid hydroxylase superfamily)